MLSPSIAEPEAHATPPAAHDGACSSALHARERQLGCSGSAASQVFGAAFDAASGTPVSPAASSASSTPSATSLSGGGASSQCARISSGPAAKPNGGLPLESSYSRQPSA